MEERDFVFDAHNNEGWMLVQESVYVAIDLTIKMFQVVFGMIAIMHGLCTKRGLRCARNEAGCLSARIFRKSRGLAELIRTFKDARVIQLQGENIELEVFAGKRQQRPKLEALTDSGDRFADEIARAD